MNLKSGSKHQMDTAAAAIHRAGENIGAALLDVAYADHTKQWDELPKAIEKGQRARQDARNALAVLLAMGAERPRAAVARDSVPLALLNTANTRALLDALEAAGRAAWAVDQERGWVDESGEAIGFFETLSGMAAQLRAEVEGPQGRE